MICVKSETIEISRKPNQEDKGENSKLLNEENPIVTNFNGRKSTFFHILKRIWTCLFGFNNLGEEWIFLSVLGIFVAFISYGIDKGTQICNNARVWLYEDVAMTPLGRYTAWLSLPLCLVLFSAGFVRLLAPNATGSGIPEIKTILRGVKLEKFLTFPTLLAKIGGITATLGSGLPLGKEGPLIHISACCAHLIGKLTNFQRIYENDCRKLEILGAASAVGVACTFGAPIGGVLLSIEITTSYFAVRNYWRGLCTAIWGATVYRLLLVWIEGAATLTVVFPTNFNIDRPFTPQELFSYAILGFMCGLGGAFYIRMRINYGKFLKTTPKMQQLQKINYFIYPGLVTVIITTLNYPSGVGKFFASHLSGVKQVTDLFSNFTWTSPNLTVGQYDIIKNWQTPYTNFYIHLICFIVYQFVCSILASSMPIPNGCFIPNFRIGAAIGRFWGEIMYQWYPVVLPSSYAIVGAAAFSGAVTQTMSICIIILEMTGQILFLIPILIGVLLANIIAQLLGPSIYNSVIKAKKLPYLPDLIHRNCAIYNIKVEDFMEQNLKYIYQGITLKDLKTILIENKNLQNFPLVNNSKQMILIGSISKYQLIKIIKDRQQIEPIKKIDKQHFTFNPIYQKSAIYEEKVIFTNCQIDTAPLQLMKTTPLIKVHALFSMVGVNCCYVTHLGHLIGIVGLKDLKRTIDDVTNQIKQQT